MKRFLSLALCFSILMSLLSGIPMPVSAEATDDTTGTESESPWDYVLSGDSVELTAYLGDSADVYIPGFLEIEGTSYPVTKLGDSIFEDNDALNSVTLSDNITDIGARAFYDADNLVCIVTNEQLTTIGDDAFNSCDSFNSIILYDTVTTIGTDAFTECNSLTIWCNEGSAGYTYAVENSIPYEILNPEATPETYVQDSITYYVMNGEAIAIDFDESCTEVIIPAVVNGYAVTELRNIFQGSSIEKVTLSAGLRTISDFAFSGCASLKAVFIPDSLTYMGEKAFYNCTSLTSITIPMGIIEIGDYTFNNCSSLESITIPESVISIGKGAFAGCNNLTMLTIPNSVTSIGNYAFGYCTSLSEITIPDGVTSIGSETFCDCTSLTRITIPDSVSSIGRAAFLNCTSLESIIIPKGVTRIESETFFDCISLTSVIIPDGVMVIDFGAFGGCRSLTTVTIPDSVTSIYSAFVACENLTDVIVHGNPANWEYSISDTFSGCSNLAGIWASEDNPYCSSDEYGVLFNNDMTTLLMAPPKLTGSYTVPDGVDSISESAFYNCGFITEITIPDSITSIGSFAFNNCTSLTSAYYSGTVTQWIDVDVEGGNNNLLEALYATWGIVIGTCGEDLTWILSKDGTLVVSGTGAMEDFSNYSLPSWAAYSTSITSVIIDDGITCIGAYAFYKCTNLESITISDSVTKIGAYAFYCCTSLEGVTIPYGVTNIGSYAFYKCTNLAVATIPDSVVSISYNAFEYTGLTTITIPGSVTSMGYKAFGNCTSLTAITIQDGVTNIGSYVFEGCTNLTTVSIPNSVTSIGNSAFSQCTSLTSFNIPAGINAIGDGVFQGCNNLSGIWVDKENLNYSSDSYGALFNKDMTIIVQVPNGLSGSYTVPDSVARIGRSAFEGCINLTAITIPDSVTRIDGSAFENCTNLIAIAIPNSVTQMDSTTFKNCTSLAAITISSSITRMGNNVFENCKSLTAITIPDGVTRIGSHVFENCTSLESVILPDSITMIGGYTFRNCTSLTSLNLPYSITSIDGYTFSNCTNLSSITIPDSATIIGGHAFYNCTSLISIIIPNNVTGIGDYAFYNCTNLTNIIIPDSVTSIGDYAFRYCTNLNTVTIPDSVTSIDDSAFYNCTSLKKLIIGEGSKTVTSTMVVVERQLTEIVIPDSVTSIGDYAFNYCTSLTTVIIPDNVTTIGDYAFSCCYNIAAITIPDSVISIGQGAFNACHKLITITIPDGVDNIGKSTFYYCNNLTEIIIPNSVTIIGDSAFRSCTGLTTITIPDGITTIGDSTFSGCTSLTTIAIPDSVTSIGGSAFSDCTNLTGVTIPDSVTSIGNYAFRNCTGLEGIILPEGVTTIGSAAFNGCTNLQIWVTIPASVITMSANSFPSGTIHMVYENSYAHTFAEENDLLYFIIRRTDNPEISYGTEITGTASYTDGSAVTCATVEVFYDDGILKESVVTNETGAYAFTYAEVGQYTIRTTDVNGNTASTQVAVKRMNAFDVFIVGDTALTLKKGYSISGTVNEPGATVTVTDTDGNIIASVTADEDGKFTVDELPNGTYVITAETENGSTSQEITVFNGDVTDITLEISAQSATVWGYVEVEARDKNHHRRNWVQVTIYNAEGLAVAQQKSDSDGKYCFTKLPFGEYSIVAETTDMRPDHKHDFDRSHTLTGYGYITVTEATEYQVDTIVLYEENDSQAKISGKVTAQGETQNCEVILHNVFRSEIARCTTGKNGKYTFENVKDGLYFVTAITESDGMGYTVVVVRDGEVYGETNITVRKTDKVKDRENKFHDEVPELNSREDALNYKDRIAEEKRFYDGLSEKEKKQLSKKYVQRLNQYIEWLANTEYVTDDGISVEQGGLVISGDEVENGDTVTFTLNVEEKTYSASTDGVHTDDDFIYHSMHDAVGDHEIRQYYEISMTKTVDGQEKTITSVSKDTDTMGKFRITLTIPEEYRGHKHYNVLHVHHGEVVTLTDLDNNPNTVTFEIDKFSTFALTTTDDILAVNGEDLEFSNASLTLYDNITVNYKADIATLESNGYTDPYAVFTLNGEEFVVKDYTVEDGEYVFAFTDIAPNRMNDVIYATLYATCDGVLYASDTFEYSIATYCYRMLKKYSGDENAELRTLLVDLLHYGAATQLFTGYRTDALANEALTPDQLVWGTAADPTLESKTANYASIANPSAAWKSVSLVLDDAITMCFKFSTADIAGLTVKIISDTNTEGWVIDSSQFLYEESTGYYYVEFGGLDASQMQECVYVSVHNGETAISNTLRYSVESYACKYQSADAAEYPYLAELVKAMMRYGDAAYAFVN